MAATLEAPPFVPCPPFSLFLLFLLLPPPAAAASLLLLLDGGGAGPLHNSTNTVYIVQMPLLSAEDMGAAPAADGGHDQPVRCYRAALLQPQLHLPTCTDEQSQAIS